MNCQLITLAFSKHLPTLATSSKIVFCVPKSSVFPIHLTSCIDLSNAEISCTLVNGNTFEEQGSHEFMDVGIQFVNNSFVNLMIQVHKLGSDNFFRLRVNVNGSYTWSDLFTVMDRKYLFRNIPIWTFGPETKIMKKIVIGLKNIESQQDIETNFERARIIMFESLRRLPIETQMEKYRQLMDNEIIKDLAIKDFES